MSEKHTQGRLEVTDQRFIRFSDGQRHFVARVTRPNSESINETEEIARRLVACWNACEGTPTAWLEGWIASPGTATFDQKIDALYAQHDELLAALEVAEGSVGDLKALEIVRAAIANVKGGAA